MKIGGWNSRRIYEESRLSGDNVPMSPIEIEEHNLAYQQATSLVKGEIFLDSHPQSKLVTQETRAKLERAIKLFERALEIHPANFAPHWFLGKIYQRMGDHSTSHDCFVRALGVDPKNADAAREASLSAMSLGNVEDGINYALSASQLKPSDTGLRANVALAFLLAGKLDQAKQTIEEVSRRGPLDSASKKLNSMIEYYRKTAVKPPSTISELETSWQAREN
jgi:tetratricopeptide (TPR) repeat protein